MIIQNSGITLPVKDNFREPEKSNLIVRKTIFIVLNINNYTS